MSALKFKSCQLNLLYKKISERQDLNLRPLPPQGSALPSCATSRYFLFNYQCCFFVISGLVQLPPPFRTILNRTHGVLATSRYFLFNYQSCVYYYFNTRKFFLNTFYTKYTKSSVLFNRTFESFSLPNFNLIPKASSLNHKSFSYF